LYFTQIRLKRLAKLQQQQQQLQQQAQQQTPKTTEQKSSSSPTTSKPILQTLDEFVPIKRPLPKKTVATEVKKKKFILTTRELEKELTRFIIDYREYKETNITNSSAITYYSQTCKEF
jgi:NAD dependent epimerase/dehydratase family enzyme